MKLYFPVPPQADGVLLRNFLRRCAVSTELARAVKFHGSGFFADGQPILANRRLAAGQMLSFELPADGEGVAPQPEIPVQVVHEDAFALLLEKPPRLAVHPTLNYPLDTLANGYAAWAAAQGRSTVFRPVNRIDKDTSGLVLAARNSYAAPLLAQGYAHSIGMRAAHVVYSPNSVANYAIMLMLMACRNMPWIMKKADCQDYSLKGKVGKELSTSTVGIIGTGNIGKTVVKHLSGFGCRILAYSCYEDEEVKKYAEYALTGWCPARCRAMMCIALCRAWKRTPTAWW